MSRKITIEIDDDVLYPYVTIETHRNIYDTSGKKASIDLRERCEYWIIKGDKAQPVWEEDEEDSK